MCREESHHYDDVYSLSYVDVDVVVVGSDSGC